MTDRPSVPRSIASVPAAGPSHSDAQHGLKTAGRQPDWGFWKNVPNCKLWEGVALSLDIDPRKVQHGKSWMVGTHIFEESDEFQKRLLLAERNSDPTANGRLQVLVGGDPPDREVSLGQFVAWLTAIFLGAVPAQFIALTTASSETRLRNANVRFVAKPRGKKPELRDRIVQRMIADYASRPEALDGEKETFLESKYEASRDTCRAARDIALDKLRQSPTIDK